MQSIWRMARHRIICGILFTFIAPFLSAQSEVAKHVNAANNQNALDVVSIRKNNSDAYSRTRTTTDSFTATNVSVFQLVYYAYHHACKIDCIIPEDLLSGLPAWTRTMRFDVIAKVDKKTAIALSGLSYEQLDNVYAKMLWPVLEDRFNLKIHFNTKKQSVYILQISKHGKKFTESTKQGPLSAGPGRIIAKGYSLNTLINNLSSLTERVVIDKTGLTGIYDYSLKWRPDDDTESDNPNPSIYTAVKEQLGLELVSSVAPVDILIVDHIDLPKEN